MEPTIKVLQIGIKEWPYEAGILEEKNRGGGVGKYAEILFNTFPNNIKLYTITRKLKGQKKFEIDKNIEIIRIKTLPGRKLRIISLGIVSLFKAIKIIRKNDIDIIHTHIFFNNIIGILLKWITKKPVIIVPHSPMYHNYSSDLVSLRRRIERFFERKIYKHANKVVMFTQEHINRYKKVIKTNKINFTVVHTGIKIEPINAPKFNFNKKLKILYVGRLQKRKAVDHSIEGISLLSPELKKQIEFNIVGEGDEKENLLKQASKLGISDIIKFHGYQSNPSNYYKTSDIFLQPTYTEGLSMALLESMMYWSACIVNNWGVPFKDGSVYVLENNSPVKIKEALELFISNKELIKEYAINARKDVEEKFSETSFTNSYIKLYKSLI